MKYGNKPTRQCMGCRRVLPKNQLLRIVQDPSGRYVFDSRNLKEGRGCYLCPDEACFEKVSKKGHKGGGRNGMKDMAELKTLIVNELSDSVCSCMSLFEKCGYLNDALNVTEDVDNGQIILVSRELEKDEPDVASSKGNCHFLPAGLMRGKKVLSVGKDSPNISLFERNIILLERLSE